MTYAQVLALIQQWIVANGNNEITANVLRPILEAMLTQPNDLIGDLSQLQTSDQSNLVAAINEILSSNIASSTALRAIDTTGIDFDQSELYWVRDAINQTIANSGNITANVGQMIVFYADVLLSEGGGMAVVQRRYYRLTSGANVVTTMPDEATPPLMPDGSGLVFLDFTDPDLVVQLGNIGTDDVWDAFNSDAGQPFTMNDNKFVVAVQGGTQKVWKWVGGDGDFGNSATPAVATDFVDLTDGANNPPAASAEYLPTKTITSTPYALDVEDLNRPLIFTSNDQVVNVPNELAGDASASGLTLFDFKATFQGTGTHTVNYPDSETQDFEQGALIYGLCINVTGDTVWVVKQWFNNTAAVLGTLHNTVIGGVGATINTKALLAAQLTGVDEEDISNFYLVGNDVYAQINANYTAIGTGVRTSGLTKYEDPEGKFTGLVQAFPLSLTRIILNGATNTLGNQIFENLTNLTYVEFGKMQEIQHNGVFNGCTSLTTVIMPRLRRIVGSGLANAAIVNFFAPLLRDVGSAGGSGGLQGNQIVSIFQPNITTLSDRAFRNSTAATSIYVPNCKSLGGAEVFLGITSGCVITVHSDLATANAGQEHAALAAARVAGATIVYHQGSFTQATGTGTVLRLDNYSGRVSDAEEYNATYTLGATLVRGGNETRTIDTTGESAFPSVTGATLVTGSDFEAGAIFEMHVYTLDGTDVRYYFLYLEPA